MRLKVAFLVLVVSLASLSARAEQAPPAGSEKAAAADQTSPAKTADIRRLLAITGAVKMGEQMLDQMLAIQQRSLPDVPAEVWKDLRAGMDANELVDLVAAVWERHFSHEDVLALITFYESPLGARLLAAQPLILQESMAAGEAWGRRSAEKVFEKLKQKGFPKKTQS